MNKLAVPALLLPLLLLGCVALPDVQPFADATAQVNNSLKEVGEITVARVANGEKVEAPGEGEEASDAWQLHEIWRTRLFAAGALVAYADSLAEIVAAGNNAANAATKLGSTISEIAAQVPGVGTLSPSVVSLGQKLVEIAIKVKTSRDLATAVEAADPGVAGIADILVEDLDDVLLLYKTGNRKVRRERYGQDSKYKKLRDHQRKLHDHVIQLRKDTALTDPEQVVALQQAEELLARANEAFAPLWDRKRALENERAEFETLIRRTDQTVRAWRQTHHDLAGAIREGRRPNWRALLTQAQELHGLVEAIREEHNKADAPQAGEGE